MNKRLALSLSCLALLATAPGCGDDEEDGGGSAQTTQEPADPGMGSGGAAAADTVRVGMKDIEYVPQDVKVKAGGTVKWTNSDAVTHTVTKESGPGGKFDSGNMAVGATFEQKFDTPGKVDYVCTIHPNQTGTVTVE